MNTSKKPVCCLKASQLLCRPIAIACSDAKYRWKTNRKIDAISQFRVQHIGPARQYSVESNFFPSKNLETTKGTRYYVMAANNYHVPHAPTFWNAHGIDVSNLPSPLLFLPTLPNRPLRSSILSSFKDRGSAASWIFNGCEVGLEYFGT